MPMIQRVRSAFKNLTTMVFGSRAIRWSAGLLGSTRVDYAREVKPDTNSIVVAAVSWLARNFPEAPPRVSLRKGVELVPVPDHPLIGLLRRPNPFYSGVLLWIATVASWLLTGNAYWVKIRSDPGRVVQLWWIPSSLIKPHWPTDGSEFIDYYEYRPDGRVAPIRYEITDIVHFRYGLDPDNPRLGLSPMASLFREIFTDDQAANFSAAILRNLGVPGVVISPDVDEMNVSPEDAEQIKTEFSDRFNADRRGQPLVLSGKSRVQVLSFSPEQMNLEKLRRLPEERVTAVLGIPAIVAGLGAGLDRSTYSNMAQSREAAFENGIIPAQRLFAEDLRVQLLVDFADVNKAEIDFDLSKVRVLQDDENKKVERLTRALLAGGMLLTEYRRQVGNLDDLPNTDVLYIPRSVTPTPADKLLVPVGPPSPSPTTPTSVNGHVPTPTQDLVSV